MPEEIAPDTERELWKGVASTAVYAGIQSTKKLCMHIMWT